MSSHYETRDHIAIISLDNPPVNGLSWDLRNKIALALKDAEADQHIRAVVLMGTSRAFSGGADIREFNSPKASANPDLPSLINRIESSAKPVIAAISGVCMGGGLELALGCHFRLALANAQIALPEVKLGILPGAGGTQRFPRLVGAEIALKLITTGDSVTARELEGSKLFTRVIDGNLFEEAITFAQAIVKEARPAPRTRDIPLHLANATDLFDKWRDSLRLQAKNFPAPLKCVEAIAAAFTLDFDQGLAYEQKLFSELVDTTTSKALRHAFFSERAAAKIKNLPESTPTRTIQKIAVVGAGTMGAGITMNFLNAGLPVTLLDQNPDGLDRGINSIKKVYESSVKKGKLSAEAMTQRLALLSPSLHYESLNEADLIIEAVFEDMNVKEQVFKKIDSVAKAGAILASNTSTLDIDHLASCTRRPQDLVGLHFFSPAHIMKLLEVIRGAKTAPEVLASAMALAKTIKKTAVVSGVCDGFIGNRMIAAYSQQAMNLLEEGALPQEIDHALEDFGMAMGPFRMSDLAGNDIGWAIRKHQQKTKADPHYPRIADRLCELGRFGQKSGAGWYTYTQNSRAGEPDPIVENLILNYRQEKGLKTRTIAADEIVGRLILALVNEGAKILAENIAQRASDIDMVYLSGYGFPIYRGGPMFYADTLGLNRVLQTMQGFFEKTRDPFWQPAAMLVKLAEKNERFNP